MNNIIDRDDLVTKKDLETFLDNLPVNFWIKDLNGKYLYTNKSYNNLLVQNNESLLGKFDEDFWCEKTSEYFSDVDSKVIATKKSVLLEEYIKYPNRDYKWFETYKIPIMGENGEVKYIGGSAREITLAKNLELEISKSYNNFPYLTSMIIQDVDQNYNELNNMKFNIMKFFKCDGLSIWIYNKNDNSLVPTFKVGLSTKVSSDTTSLKLSEKDLSKILNDDIYNKILDFDILDESFNLKNLKDNNIAQIGMYKIMIDNEFLGILSILYEEDNSHQIQEYSFIECICNQIGLLIKNNQLSKNLSIELEKRIKTEKELEDFLETAVDLMAIMTIDGKFIKVNSGWTKTLGWSKEELLTTNWKSIIHKDDLDFTSDFLENNKNSTHILQLINRYNCKNGNICWLDWSFKYVSDNCVCITTARDITEKKEIQAQQQKYESALQLESMKNEFFANVSHEFKTPLNIILATIQLLNNNIKNSDIDPYSKINLPKYMNSIKQNSYRLLRLINNLIDMSRIDTGYYEIHLENHNIVSIVEDITISVANYVEDKCIQLVFDTDVEEMITACDPDKIERILLNLLSNAIKYTSKHGIITVNLHIIDDEVSISVKDNGIGIPSDKLNSVFERFKQVDNTLTRQCTGSGIGLSLVKSLVEMHNGSISVTSVTGQGSEFTFKLPIRTVKHVAKQAQTDIGNNKIGKCNLEFSDIYDLCNT